MIRSCKILYYLLVYFSIAISLLQGKSLSFKFDIPKPEFLNGQIVIKDYPIITKPFVPAVSVKPLVLYLGENEKATSVLVDYEVEKSFKIPDSASVTPVIPSGCLESEPPVDLKYLKSAVFNENINFPLHPHDFELKYKTQFKNGHGILYTTLFPVQYNPAKKEVRYFQKIIIHIETEKISPAIKTKTTNQIKNEIYNLVDNKNDFDTLFCTTPYAEAKRYNQNYQYLIITTEELKDYFSDFLLFNKKRGLVSKIVTTEAITQSCQGLDIQEKIKNYIIEEYNNYSLEYVLLAGSYSEIPAKEFSAITYDYGVKPLSKIVLSDLYYSCLDSNSPDENFSPQEVFQNQDILSEIKIGRFPVDNVYDLQNIIDKSINYTLKPKVNKVKNIGLIGELLYSEDQGYDFENCWGYNFLKELKELKTYSATFSNLKFFELYDFPNTYSKGWQGADVIKFINENEISFINHIGHAAPANNFRVSISDLASNPFTNNGLNSNFFIVYSQGSNSLPFGVKLITNPFGAVAYIGNSNSALATPFGTYSSSQRFHKNFLLEMSKNRSTSGRIFNSTREKLGNFILNLDNDSPPYFNFDLWTALSTNLLGDPALEIWKADVNEHSDEIPAFITEKELNLFLKKGSRILLTGPNKQEIIYQNTYTENDYLYINNEIFSSYLDSLITGSFFLFLDEEGTIPVSKEILFDLKLKSKNSETLLNDKKKLSVHPNPFNNQCTITYNLSVLESVTVSIYNNKGQLLEILQTGQFKEGPHQIVFDGKDYKSGIYYCEFKSEKQTDIIKLILIK